MVSVAAAVTPIPAVLLVVEVVALATVDANEVAVPLMFSVPLETDIFPNKDTP